MENFFPHPIFVNRLVSVYRLVTKCVSLFHVLDLRLPWFRIVCDLYRSDAVHFHFLSVVPYHVAYISSWWVFLVFFVFPTFRNFFVICFYFNFTGLSLTCKFTDFLKYFWPTSKIITLYYYNLAKRFILYLNNILYTICNMHNVPLYTAAKEKHKRE